MFKQENNHIELTTDLSDLPAEERDARRKALKLMLSKNVARQQAVLRQRPPSMALGEQVKVVGGELSGELGTIVDADFIHTRVLLEIDGLTEAHWVAFRYIAQLDN